MGGGHPKVTCTTIFSLDDNVTTVRKDDEHFTNWITKSNAKNSSRRQSLDILIDASDKVKDVFTLSFQKVGKSLERRSSESEVSSDSSDFFSFTRYVVVWFFVVVQISLMSHVQAIGPTIEMDYQMNKSKICY